MKRSIKCALLIMLAVAVFIGLTGCGDSLKKPTGLESDDNEPEMDEQVAVGDSGEENRDQDQETIERSAEDEGHDEESEREIDSKSEQTDDMSKNESSSQSDQPVKNKTQSKGNSSSSGPEKTSDSAQAQAKSNTKKSGQTKEKKSTAKPGEKQEQKQKKKDPPKKNDSKSKNEKPAPPPKPSKPSVTHSIVITSEGSSGQQWCKDNPGKGGCPTDGSAEVPLPAAKIDITEEETVLDVLIRVTQNRKIQMDYRGGQGATAYVEGIRNVYEFDRGQGSGWMYRINGVFPDRGAGVVPLCDGDRIEWLYTNNLGKDLGADLKPVRRDGKCPS